MKEAYEVAEMEIIEFETEDVITSSVVRLVAVVKASENKNTIIQEAAV